MTIHDDLAAIRERHVDHSTVHQGKPGNLVSPYCCGLAQMGATGPGVCNACAQPSPCDASRQANALQAVVDVVDEAERALGPLRPRMHDGDPFPAMVSVNLVRRAIEEAMEAGA